MAVAPDEGDYSAVDPAGPIKQQSAAVEGKDDAPCAGNF
jgi:hypothetical protein